MSKIITELRQHGKLTVRNNRASKEERALTRESSMEMVQVCLTCKKKKCLGEARCARRELIRRGSVSD